MEGFSDTAATAPHHHLEEGLRWALQELRRADVETPQLDAEVLMSHATGLTRTQLVAHPDRRLSEIELRRFREWVSKRASRYPLAYIIGKKEFWGLEFEVNPSVLIPRPETEGLVEAAVEWLRGRAVTVVDIGAGSGAIAVALAKELPDARILGTEISPEAAATATRNVHKHGLSDRVEILTGDLADPVFALGLSGQVEAIVSNPPYISSDAVETMQPEVLHEPRSATVAGPDSVLFYRRILEISPRLLKSRGRVFLEIDPGQALPISDIARDHGLSLLETRRDLAGLERIAILECKS